MKEWILENTSVDEVEYDKLINHNVVNLLNQNEEERMKISKKYKLSRHPLNKISDFTYKKPSKFRCKIYDIKIDSNYYIYKGIKFSIISELLPELEKELYNRNRDGKCLQKSSYICSTINNSKMITAMCINPFVTPSKKMIHAFVQIEKKDGKKYILDGTINAIIEKELYFKLFNVEVISEISREELINDIEYIKKMSLSSKISFLEYLCFPQKVNDGVKRYIKSNRK